MGEKGGGKDGDSSKGAFLDVNKSFEILSHNIMDVANGISFEINMPNTVNA